MTSIDDVIADLTRSRTSLRDAVNAIARATELTVDIKEQLAAMGAYAVADRFTPVLDLIEQATARLADGLAMADEAIRLAWLAKGEPHPGGGGHRPRDAHPPRRDPVTHRPGQGADPDRGVDQPCSPTSAGSLAPGGSDRPPIGGPRPQLPTERVRELLHALPVFAGPGAKTRGTLVGPDGDGESLISGENDETKALAARVGLGRVASAETHVEAHAAQTMRTRGIRSASLVINQRPCPGMFGCDTLLPRLLAPGAQLTVYGPNGFERTYVGREGNPS